jgi:hypothetical protein
VKWLLTVGWAVFVLGGLGVGWASLSRFARLAQTAPARPEVTSATLALTPEPLAPHPQLRDFDQSPPPFAAAGEPQAQPTV